MEKMPIRNESIEHIEIERRKRSWALKTLCLGVLMMALDGSIVNIALPTIKSNLGFSDASLVWVVNAYLLTYAGFRLLSGRIGDLFGYRRLFLHGITLFTLASLACALSNSQSWLIGSRAVQGLGGAMVGAVALPLIANLFPDGHQRAKAFGIYGLVTNAGGAAGLLVGGALTDTLNWHWIFLINLPVGILIFTLGLSLLPEFGCRKESRNLDIAGALTMTTWSLVTAYTILNGSGAGWGSIGTVVLVFVAALLLMVFVGIEARAYAPIMPLRLFETRNFASCVAVGVLMSTAGSADIFTSLYLQRVLAYNPLDVGLAFLPSSLIMALSISFSTRLVVRFGIRVSVLLGLLLATTGLMLLAQVPVEGELFADVLPGNVLLALGLGIASNPLVLAALGGVSPTDAGVASAILSTSATLGGALDFSILASIASVRTNNLLVSGVSISSALTSGYHLAFIGGSVAALSAAIIGTALLRFGTGKWG